MRLVFSQVVSHSPIFAPQMAKVFAPPVANQACPSPRTTRQVPLATPTKTGTRWSSAQVRSLTRS